MGFCSCTVKYLLFLFNILCAIAGIAILVTGVLVNQHGSSFKNLLEGEISATSITLMVVGTVVFVIAFFGCCGAIREDSCMITTYGVILLTIFIVEVSIGIVALVYKNKVETKLTEAFDKEFLLHEFKETSDLVQQNFHCCGIQGPSDWTTNIPLSCCKDSVPSGGKCSPGNYWTDGCEKVIKDITKKSLNIIAAVALGVGALELLCVICALCLASSIRRSERRGYA